MMQRRYACRLRAKLEEAGVDVEALLEGVGGDDEDNDAG